MVDESAASDAAVLAAADVEFRANGPGQCEIAVGPRTYSLAAAPEAIASLADAVERIVPALRRALPLARQLGPAEIERLTPVLGRLRELGVLLEPAAGTVVEDEAARRLYTYIWRRAARDPDRTFAEVRARRVRVAAPPAVAEPWCRLLREQGLVATAGGYPDLRGQREDAAGRPDAAPHADLTVVVSHDEAQLAAANRRLCADRLGSVAVLVGPHRFRIGPWVKVSESACLRCFAGVADALTGASAGSGASTGTRDAPGSSSGTGRRRAPGARSGWATFQPGSLAWAGGLVSHLALRAMVPMSAEHPWGRVTTIDVVDLEQSSVTALRDPFCPDCAAPAPAAMEWVAL
jgi:hypothetical protein